MAVNPFETIEKNAVDKTDYGEGLDFEAAKLKYDQERTPETLRMMIRSYERTSQENQLD